MRASGIPLDGFEGSLWSRSISVRLFILVNFNVKPTGPFESTIDDVARSEMHRMLIWIKYMVVKVRCGKTD